MRISTLALLAAVATLASAPRGAAAQGEFHWKGKVAPGKAIEIKGVNGARDGEWEHCPKLRS